MTNLNNQSAAFILEVLQDVYGERYEANEMYKAQWFISSACYCCSQSPE